MDKEPSSINKEDFFFFIYNNTIPFENKKEFQKGCNIFVKKTQDEIERHYLNNILWGKKIFRELLLEAIYNAEKLSKKLSYAPITNKPQRELSEWM